MHRNKGRGGFLRTKKKGKENAKRGREVLMSEGFRGFAMQIIPPRY